ncbi:DNA-binding transcriptional LysR family regulator [Paraburkholderia sp. BL23I1N1]|uniref:LysR family transcriptional regulator n=1 Tax=unclassified Paraburkholderia TaxID=2615204 RepID=UPI000E720017|nr:MULTISPECIES: LysR family transcriptional regulator [unclassified Paraburkholderia]RKE23860.1 DNA-binding transcriptional LysR family regulator [Paraburkholderia sp. BL23I1N1]TDY15587.1 DNA-binding transcriptional LysR family regulator [Paraburkholderia sp. BL6665CI2N2]
MSQQDRLLNLSEKDILLLKIFESVVRAGGYTAAEACLNKSKSAISIHISTLEARLGKTLCHRGRSGFSLTPEGEQIYKICQDLFSDLNGYRERLNHVSSLVGGVLRVALDDTIYGHFPVLENVFEKINNGATTKFLEVYFTSPERVLKMLADGEADIGIGAVPREIPETKAYLLYEESLALYCGAKHPLFHKNEDEITDSELAKCEGVDFWAYQDSEFEAAMNSFSVTARSGQAMARLLLVLSGKWVTLLPRDFAAEWVASGRLREIRRVKIASKQKYYAVVRSEIASNTLCKQMVHELKRAFVTDVHCRVLASS